MHAFYNTRPGTKERALGEVQKLVGGADGGVHVDSEMVGVRERGKNVILFLPLLPYIQLYSRFKLRNTVRQLT